VIVGAAILPTAPLLVPGASQSLPEGIAEVCAAIDFVVGRLAAHDVAILIGAGPRGAIYDAASAGLGGIGRPELRRDVAVHGPTIEVLSGLVQYPVHRGEALSLDLAVLTLLVGGEAPLVPMEVPPTASFDALTGIGVGVAAAVSDPDLRAIVVASGDCAAGLSEAAPLHLLPGARAVDEQILDAVDSGRLDGLRRIPPAEAGRVGARGWAPMAVLHGALARAQLGIMRRHYSAPRGVGYLVASGG
jgi:hypothetical protein